MANAPHDRKLCKYGDPFCPCQDGDPCHYEGENPMTPPARQPDALDEFPTIRALADVSQTTVGYQKHDLVAEAVACWRELERLREELEASKTDPISWCSLKARNEKLREENARLNQAADMIAEERETYRRAWNRSDARIVELERGLSPRAEALLAENARLRDENYIPQALQYAKDRAEKAESELRQERLIRDAREQDVAAIVAERDARGYANLGIGAYLINHSRAGEIPELVISIATEQEKEGRVVGDERDNPPDSEVRAEDMVVRIGFANVVGLDALEAQLRWVRKVHFDAALADLEKLT